MAPAASPQKLSSKKEAAPSEGNRWSSGYGAGYPAENWLMWADFVGCGTEDSESD